MAPEQFANPLEVDLRVDIYSFGVMLYQMVSGELPFVGESWGELEHLHKTRPAPYLTKTDPRLAEVIQLCLEKDPARRFSRFTQLRDRLGEIFRSVTGSLYPAPVQGAALSAVEWNNKGSSLDNLGRRAESIACYDSAIRLDPTLASAWFNKGVALFATGKVTDALLCYEEALKLNPNSEGAWSNKGVALKSLGKIQEAVKCYDRALSIHPRYPNAWLNKGVALRALGKNQEALACYERAVRLDPNNGNGWTNMGNALYALGRPAEAIPCYERALVLNPRLDVTWLNKGMALGALKRHSECIGMLRERLANQSAHGKGLVSQRHDSCQWTTKLSRGRSLFRRSRAAGFPGSETSAYVLSGCFGETVEPIQSAEFSRLAQ